MKKVYIEPHTTIDKSFEFAISGLSMKVDFDDVNHPEVEAQIIHLQEIVEQHWNEEKVKILYKEQLQKEWNENKYNLQSEYDNETHFLNERGIEN